MNIAMFADCYHPAINGVVSAIAALKKELETQGHTVYLFAPGYKDYADTEKNIFRFASIPYPFQQEHRFSFPFPRKNIKIIPELKLDVIHIHTPFPIGMIGLKTAGRHKIPAVFTHHTLWEKYTHYFPVLPAFLRVRIAINLCRNFANKCRMVIAPSTSVKNTFASQGVKTKIEIVPSGIYFEKFSSGNAEKFYDDYPQLRDKKILAFSGRLGREKNLEFLFRAFKIVSEKNGSARLIIIGNGPERVGLENYAASLGIKDKVTFCGYLAQDKIADILAAAYLFFFASTTETQGLVIQEAQAAGCPSAAVRASGVEDAVADGVDGYLTGENEEELARKALELLENNALRNTMSKNARIKAKEYSIENTAKKTLKVYEEAISGS